MITPLQGHRRPRRCGRGHLRGRPVTLAPRAAQRSAARRPDGDERATASRSTTSPAGDRPGAPAPPRDAARDRGASGSASRRPGVAAGRLLGSHDRGVRPRRVRSVDARRSPASAPPGCSSTASCWPTPPTRESGAGLLGLFTAAVECEVELVAGTTYEVVAEFDAARADGPIALAGLTVEARPPDPARRGRARRAAAADADVAVVVVGHDERESPRAWTPPPWTCRPTRSSSIRQVAAANPRTVVVVNAAVAGHHGLGRRRRRGRAAGVPRPGDRRRPRRGAVRRRRRLGPAHHDLPGAGSRMRRPTPTSPVATGRSPTPRASSSATATTTPTASSRAGASATACRTRPSTTRPSSVAADRATAAPAVGACRSTSPTPGARSGSEVVQVYVRPSTPTSAGPDRELGAFEKVALDPGETAP